MYIYIYIYMRSKDFKSGLCEWRMNHTNVKAYDLK